MSEELKPCPLCGGHAEIRNVGYEDQRPQCVMSKCRIGTVETFYSSEQATRYWNNLPRIDEQKKAEIVAQMWGEYFCENGSVTPQEPTAKFLHWIEQKAKGER